MLPRFSIDAKTTTKDKGARRILREIASIGNGVSITTGIHSPEGSRPAMYRGKMDGKTPLAQYANWQEFGAPKAKIPKRPTFGPTVIKNASRFTAQTAAGMRKIYSGSMTVNKLMRMQGIKTKGWLKNRIMVLNTPANSPSTLRRKRARNRGSNPLIDSGTFYKSIKSKIHKSNTKNLRLMMVMRDLEKAMKGVKP